MNKLSLENRATILHLLCQGMSVRAVTVQTGASKNTVAKLLVDAGKTCAEHHDAKVCDVRASQVQVDAIWSFTYSGRKNFAMGKEALEGTAEAWTWTALDTDSKLIISYAIGARDAGYASSFMKALGACLNNRLQLATDNHRTYLKAIEGASGCDVDYAQLINIYGQTAGAQRCYSPTESTATKKAYVTDSPTPERPPMSSDESQKPEVRMHMPSFGPLTKSASKKVENYGYAVALHMMYYNFVRISKTLSVTPAMAAGIADRKWEIMDIAKLVEDVEAKHAKHGPFKS